MRCLWDPKKNESNIAKHGFDFCDAREIFDAPMLIAEDDRFDYGEERWLGIGLFRGQVMVVAYTEPDDETLRIISVRKALKHERKEYEKTFKNRS